MQVVGGDDAGFAVVAHGVGAAVGESAFHAAAGHPLGVAAAIVSAAVVGFVVVARSAAEFAAPEDEGVLEHVALFQLGDEACDGFIDAAGLARDAFAELLMMVLAGAGELDEADAFFGHAAGHQALRAKALRCASSRPYMSRMCCGSLSRSSTSGTLVCIL